MLAPKEMTKVSIVSTKAKLREVVEKLYEMEILHIDEFTKTDESFFDIGRPFDETSAWSEQLIRLHSAISHLNVMGEGKKVKSLKAAKKRFTTLYNGFSSLVKRMDQLKAEQSRLNEIGKNPVLNLNLTPKYASFKSIASFIGTADKSLLLEKGDYQMLKHEMEDKVAIALFVPRKSSESVQQMLEKHGFVEYPIPEITQQKLQNDMKKATRGIDELGKKMDAIKASNGQFLLDYAYTLEQFVEKGEAPLRFATSSNTFMASGWIPTDRKADFENEVTKVTGEKIAIYYQQTADAPVQLNNPKLARPFEFLINLFTLPKYKEIDPTLIFLITFPIFFGFILGDVGYGIALFIISFVVGRIFPKGAEPLFQIIRISSIFGIAFGFIFGEFFGFEFIRPLLNRLVDVNTLMYLTVAMGAIHVNLGLAFGFANELKRHGIKQAIFTKGGWYAIEAGAGLMGVGFLISHILLMQAAGVAVLLAGVLMIFKGEGIKGIVELPTIFTNMLSYIRLFAVGLASIALAAVINNGSVSLMQQGGVMIIAAVALFAGGHFINLLLGIMGSFLHPLRLHYVEFFTKFFEGGGKQYMPFGKRNGGR